MILLELFLSFCYIGALSFGGGYAALPLIQQQCVGVNNWLTMTEFSDLLTISQITPGPIAINSATFVGMKVAGIPGALIATLGFMLPPFIIATILYLLFKKYGQLRFMQDILSALKPAVAGLIACAAVGVIVEAVWGESVVLAQTDILAAALTLVTFFVLRKWKTGIIVTILSCGAVGVLWEVISGALH